MSYVYARIFKSFFVTYRLAISDIGINCDALNFHLLLQQYNPHNYVAVIFSENESQPLRSSNEGFLGS